MGAHTVLLLAVTAFLPDRVDPCDRPVPGTPSEPWRLVRATGFTFCVPMSWRPMGRGDANRDASRWADGDGWVRWGLGMPVEDVRRRRRFALEYGLPLPPPCGKGIRRTETNDGRSVDLYANVCQGRHYSGATWTRPVIYFRGESKSEAAALLQLDVYRTVRFDTSVAVEPRASCSFDTAALVRQQSVAIGLGPSRSLGSGATDFLGAAEAIKLHYQAPQRLTLPFWARIIAADSTHRDTSDDLGHGLDTDVSFRLTGASRLVDSSIAVQSASPEVDSSLVSAIRRADSADAFMDTGTVALRLMDWTKRKGPEVGLVRLVIPTIRANSDVKVLSIDQVHYPESAIASNIGGSVTLEFVVTELGDVDPTTFRVVSGEYPELALEAMNAVVQGRFEPARVRACPVPALAQQVLEFRIR